LTTTARPVRPDLATLDDWLQWLEVLHPKKIDLALERVHAVLAALGLKPPPYRVLSVAGTNGKGSSVAMLESIYRHAGYRVGAYTSPHLWRFNERIRVDGVEATDAELLRVFEAVDGARGETSLSYFEYATVAAMLYFAERGVAIVVLEVGLGGRLDAVNAMDADLALVSSIALDHQHWLGETRDAIGVEKAGILRAAKPAIMADPDPPPAFLRYATELGAELRRADLDFTCSRNADGTWTYRSAAAQLERLPQPSLPGAVQYGNAAACVAAVEAMQPILPVAWDVLAPALTQVYLAGRLQTEQIHGTEWVFDVAHNPAAAATLGSELARRPVPGRSIAIVGLMADKDIAGVLRPLIGIVDTWLVTHADTERASATSVLAATLRGLGCADISEFTSPELAYERALALAGAGDRVVTFGSFRIVGPVMTALRLYFVASSSGALPAIWTGD
jgi:dihydrofolate synthase/folylpolyglutamate synthase